MADIQKRVRKAYGRDEERENEYADDSGQPTEPDTFADAVDAARNDPATFAREPDPEATRPKPPAPPPRNEGYKPLPAAQPSPEQALYSDSVVGGMSEEQQADVAAGAEELADAADAGEDVEADEAMNALQVDPQVYQDFREKLNGALSTYRQEVNNTKKAKLWSSIVQALGMLALARTTSGFAGGPDTVKFVTPDFEGDLAQAARNFDAERGVLKEGLATEERQVEENRAVKRLEEVDIARQDRKERSDERKADKTAKDEQGRADKRLKDMNTRKDKLVTNFNKIVTNKKLSSDERAAQVDLAIAQSGLPMSKEIRDALKSEVGGWSTDVEDASAKLQEWVEQEFTPWLQGAAQSSVAVTKGGETRYVPRENVQALVEKYGWTEAK